MWEKIQQAIVYLKLGLAIVPEIIDLIKKIELPGNGPDKLALLLQIVGEAWELVPEELRKVLGLATVQRFVEKVTGYIVIFLNKFGVFKHT